MAKETRSYGDLKTLYTPWGENLDRSAPLQEYPRPQLRRDSYLNLNGVWHCAFSDRQTVPREFTQEIVVPFSPESPLSGVNRQLQPKEAIWYRRHFVLPAGFKKDRVLLHFGAVDQICTVYVNGQKAGAHAGGYLPFTVDVTDWLLPAENDLVVRVVDETEGSIHAHGKQRLTPGGIWYTAQSGIWQTVWLESVPTVHIKNVKITPLFDEMSVRIELETSGETPARASVLDGGFELVGGDFNDGVCQLKLPSIHPWSPEDPYLYDLMITAGGDKVDSYFAMRKFGVMEWEGHKVLALNNRPYFHNGLLDQGYWSDGLYTAPSDEAMIYDIQTMKDLGFNMLRKHIKIEPLRWYYHCDRLGMLVWQDMVSCGEFKRLAMQMPLVLDQHISDRKKNYKKFSREDEKGRDQYVEDLNATIELLYNSPSLALWVPFNEGWGQFDSLEITQMIRELDPTRPIDHASGWNDQGGGDLKSRHVYFKPVKLKNDGKRVLALTEFGGYSLTVEDHMAAEKKFGYRTYTAAAEWQDAYDKLYEDEVIPLIASQGLSAAVYTQVSDVEEEVNGLLTYDRKVCKADRERLRALNNRLKF